MISLPVLTNYPKEVQEKWALLWYPTLLAQELGINPDEWQDKVINSTAPQILLNCCRQSGKSTITALMALRHALLYDGAMVLIISHTQQQAAETFKKVMDFYRKLGVEFGHPEVSTVHRLELENGSRIITLSGQRPDSIRGYSAVTLLIVDEASQVMDEAYHVARPMLVVSGGSTILLSTPHGRDGFFYNAWQHEEGWLKIHVPWTECPRLTEAEIERERRSFPAFFFRQEYECSFEEGNQSIINPAAIRKAFENDLPAEDYPFMDETWDSKQEHE